MVTRSAPDILGALNRLSTASANTTRSKKSCSVIGYYRASNFLAAELLSKFLQLQDVVKTQLEVVNQMRIRFFIFLVLFAFAFAQSALFAQGTCNPPCPSPNPCPQPCPSPSPVIGSTQWEISPYAGYIWNGNNNGVGSFMSFASLGYLI